MCHNVVVDNGITTDAESVCRWSGGVHGEFHECNATTEVTSARLTSQAQNASQVTTIDHVMLSLL